MNCPIIFLDCDNKTKLALASFSCFLDFHEKMKSSLENFTVLIVIIYLYRNEISLLNCFVYIALTKNVKKSSF